MLFSLKIVSGIVHNDLVFAILWLLPVIPAGTERSGFFSDIVEPAFINSLQLSDPCFGRLKILLSLNKLAVLNVTDLVR